MTGMTIGRTTECRTTECLEERQLSFVDCMSILAGPSRGELWLFTLLALCRFQRSTRADITVLRVEEETSVTILSSLVGVAEPRFMTEQ